MNKTIAIVITVIVALCCLCAALFACIFGGMIVAGQPINTPINGETTQQVYPPTYGVALLCLSVLFVLVPVAVGFFTLRKKPAQVETVPPDEPLPPAS